MTKPISPFVHDTEKSKKRQNPIQSEPSQKDPTNYKQKVIRFSAIKLEESVISRQDTHQLTKKIHKILIRRKHFSLTNQKQQSRLATYQKAGRKCIWTFKSLSNHSNALHIR